MIISLSFRDLCIVLVVVFLGYIYFLILVWRILNKYDQVTEIKGQEFKWILLTLFITGALSAFLVHHNNLWVYLDYIFTRILVYGLLKDTVVGGLCAGFMTTAQLGYLYYIVVVPRIVFDNYEDSFFLEHHQKRVGAVASFAIGQLIMFTSVFYSYRPIHKILVRPDCIFLIFAIYFLIQVAWTYLTIVRNRRFLYPRDKRRRVVRRIVFLQMEFVCNFFLQLSLLPSNSYVAWDSQVWKLVNNYIWWKRNKLIFSLRFVKASFFSWLIGHIVFMTFYVQLFRLLVFITIWLRNWWRKRFFDKDK